MFVILLEFESDGDRKGHTNTGVVMGDHGVSIEETDIEDAEKLGLTIFGFHGGLQLFARPHGEVESTEAKLT
eukprot:scaffold52738_cov65-Attheya_sp.AAC.4